jgi:four helix bundle protein
MVIVKCSTSMEDHVMARGDDLQERFIDFSVGIIKVTEQLPSSPAGKHIAGQLLRSGTSPAFNYGEARGAESRNDFVHKLRVVLKELNETAIALEIARRADLLSGKTRASLQTECSELQKIIGASIRTAGGRSNG